MDAEDVRIDHFYHAGLSRWKTGSGDSSPLGRVREKDGVPYLVDLLGDRESAEEALGEGYPEFDGWWHDFIDDMAGTETTEGEPTPFARISRETGALPGFDAESEDRVHIEVLGPVTSEVDGDPALRFLNGDESTARNGHSVVARVDYGGARLLLTGDLNTASQSLLLESLEDPDRALECDVAKACHHGSSHVSYEFLEKTNPTAAVVSSGDNEGYSHPRPNVLAAYALSGRRSFEGEGSERMVEHPLLYSTELARSTKYGEPKSVDVADELVETETATLEDVTVQYRERNAGDKYGEEKSTRLSETSIVSDLVYGLVNVRTDGDRILCATMDEANGTWNYQTFEARFGD